VPRAEGGRGVTLAFRGVLAAFVGLTLLLARDNNSPGSSDSCGNLVAARNLVKGRGYVSNGVGELWVPHRLPFPETVRPPGLPYLLAALFRVFGVSLAVPVLLNGATVVLTAFALRRAIVDSGSQFIGDFAGLLVLLSYNLEMVSIWNNNLLASCVAVLLSLAARRDVSTAGSRWYAIALATTSAVGFLLKPTFLLSAIPFCVFVLGTEGQRSQRSRRADLVVFIGVFLTLTSVYWALNLFRHGDAFYSPSFASSRLAVRYGVLGTGTWRTVRFGRPMTYNEVVRSVGWLNLLLIDLKMMAKTVFYSVCMNPALAVIAAGSMVLWRGVRWRDYAGVAFLMLGVVFEVGVYNHHESRYLWPLYPCLLFQSWLTVRDFNDWGSNQMSPDLAARVRRSFVAFAVMAVLISGLGALEAWRQAFRSARQPTPPWVIAVSRLPHPSVVLTSDVGSVLWWTDRKSVLCPLGSRNDLFDVITFYKTNMYLAIGDEDLPGSGVAFRAEDLKLLDQGVGWKLFRIVVPSSPAASLSATLGCPSVEVPWATKSHDCLTVPPSDGLLDRPIAPPDLGLVPRGVATMAKPLLADGMRAVIEPQLPDWPPNPEGGHPRLDDRKPLTGDRFVFKTGIPREDLAHETGCGCGTNCLRRLRDRQAGGSWDEIHRDLLPRLRGADKIDLSRALTDSGTARAAYGGEGPGPGPVGRGKPGARHHVITDASGIPLAGSVTPANRNDVTGRAPPVNHSPERAGTEGRPGRKPYALQGNLA